MPNTANTEAQEKSPMARRFRGYLPIVVDIETGGFNAKKDAILEIAAVVLAFDENGYIHPQHTHACHVEPFPGANLDPKALEFTGIDPYHPFRMAKPESEALPYLFTPIRKAIRDAGCTRGILVGHNPSFDLGFLNAAVTRTGIKRNPFHPFSSFDTATLGGLFYGQTVLARAAEAAGIKWNQDQAHSAIYDAERTAELFCEVTNKWKKLGGGII